MALYLRPFVTSQSSVETDERIELVFGMEAFLDLCRKEIPGISKNKLFPSRTLSDTLGFRKFHHGPSIVATFRELSSTTVGG